MATTGRVIRILVAEDNPEIRKLLIAMLQHLGHYVESCSDGQEVLECLEITRYALLVLDHRMPRKTGIEVIQTLRVQGNSVPVVLVTGMVREKPCRLCEGLENVRILPKPFSFSGLRNTINAITRSVSADSLHS